jgi:hypothetical protein
LNVKAGHIVIVQEEYEENKSPKNDQRRHVLKTNPHGCGFTRFVCEEWKVRKKEVFEILPVTSRCGLQAEKLSRVNENEWEYKVLPIKPEAR